MTNMSKKKVRMPEQPPLIRNRNFEEVALGYTPRQAMEEAERCLQCKTQPCVAGCPVGVPIPEFIQLIADGDFEAAYQMIITENSLPAVCGRVCPQENQCEGVCIRGKKAEPVGIGRLERFAADYALSSGFTQNNKTIKNGIKIAVVGGGPAGLSCAGDLAKLGYDVTIFEALHELGGVLTYGIPEFRLPKDLVQEEINKIAEMGVTILRNVIVGRSITVDELLEQDYKAVFVGSGAGLPRFMGIEGENLNGVYSANEYLTRVNLMRAYDYPKYPTPVKTGKRVAVVGGGNVAMDAARTALRLGAEEVSIVYRRGMDELPARAEEVHHAMEEGIKFRLLVNPVRIIGDGTWVQGMECVEMELGEPDASGRRSPREKADSMFTIELETVIMAIGQNPNPLIRQTTSGLDTHRWGGIIVEEATMQSSKIGVYAGGDAVTGAATVILAMGAGKKAAKAIHESLRADQKNKTTI
ncbi:MAG: NADPH-dependent glutamate synthase [Gorillibacterium sp.]|nr:NADPH-dependent glutamate synthase [Gorillibacterium sp.]